MKFRKKPLVIEATQWFKNGDHPEDQCEQASHEAFLTEGKVVRYYRHPRIDGRIVCSECERAMNDHGWIDTLEGGHVVCVGDWIITGIRGERYPCKPDIFANSYEAVEEN